MNGYHTDKTTSNVASHERVLDNNEALYGLPKDGRWIGDMAWASVATRFCVSNIRMYADGLATAVHPLVGRKLWLIFTR